MTEQANYIYQLLRRRRAWWFYFCRLGAALARCVSDRVAGLARRQRDAAAARLQHEVARHLHDVGAPVELLQPVLEEVRRREGVAVGLDVAVARCARRLRVAPADRPAGVLRADL